MSTSEPPGIGMMDTVPSWPSTDSLGYALHFSSADAHSWRGTFPPPLAGVAGRQNFGVNTKWDARAAYRGCRSRSRHTWIVTVVGLSYPTSRCPQPKNANASLMPCRTASVRSVGNAIATGAFE